MNVPQILMTNGDILFTLPDGPHYVTPTSFNYRRIKSLLPITLTDLTPLLIVPPTPNGVFYVHAGYTLRVLHITNDGTTSHFTMNTIDSFTTSSLRFDYEVNGVYTSLEDVYLDFPEYLL